MARNAPGSFALFGANAFVKGKVFGLEDYRKATWMQTIASSIAGSFASIVVSAPFDVIKTRIQSKAVGSPGVSGFAVVADMAKNEGVGAFFKGLTPKILIVVRIAIAKRSERKDGCRFRRITDHLSFFFPFPIIDGFAHVQQGPKLVFSFTIAQKAVPFFHKLLDGEEKA